MAEEQEEAQLEDPKQLRDLWPDIQQALPQITSSVTEVGFVLFFPFVFLLP